MTGIDALPSKEAADAAGTSCGLPTGVAPAAGDGLASRTLLSKASYLLNIAPGRRRPQAQPSARDGVWFNTAQPPDDPETSWPSTVLNPFAADCDEPDAHTDAQVADVTQLADADGGYGCPGSPADPDGNRGLITIARRRHGRHAAPPAGIGSRLARKLAANR